MNGWCNKRADEWMKIHPLAYSLGLKTHPEFKFVHIRQCIQGLDRKKDPAYAFALQHVTTHRIKQSIVYMVVQMTSAAHCIWHVKHVANTANDESACQFTAGRRCPGFETRQPIC